MNPFIKISLSIFAFFSAHAFSRRIYEPFPQFRAWKRLMSWLWTRPKPKSHLFYLRPRLSLWFRGQSSNDRRPVVVSHDGRLPLICADATFEEALRPAWDVRDVSPITTLPNIPFNRILANVTGAWGVIYSPELLDYLWMLPRGARVFELSSQDTKAHRMSTVAGLRHIFTTKAKLLNTLADTS